jgi:hypothetical protein
MTSRQAAAASSLQIVPVIMCGGAGTHDLIGREHENDRVRIAPGREHRCDRGTRVAAHRLEHGVGIDPAFSQLFGDHKAWLPTNETNCLGMLSLPSWRGSQFAMFVLAASDFRLGFKVRARHPERRTTERGGA